MLRNLRWKLEKVHIDVWVEHQKGLLEPQEEDGQAPLRTKGHNSFATILPPEPSWLWFEHRTTAQ